MAIKDWKKYERIDPFTKRKWTEWDNPKREGTIEYTKLPKIYRVWVAIGLPYPNKYSESVCRHFTSKQQAMKFIKHIRMSE